jgi:hypothetical protein
MSHSSGTSITSASSVSSNWSGGTGVSVSAEGVTQSTSETSGSGETFSESSSETFGTTESEVDSESESTGRQFGRQTARSTGQSIGLAKTRTVVPFYIYKKRQIISSRTFLSEAEFLTLALQKLRLQPRGHFALKVPGKPVVFLRARRVNEPWLSERARDRALEQVFSQSYYSSPEQIAEEENARRKLFLVAPLENSDTIEGHLSNDEVRSTRPRRTKKKIPRPPTD